MTGAKVLKLMRDEFSALICHQNSHGTKNRHPSCLQELHHCSCRFPFKDLAHLKSRAEVGAVEDVVFGALAVFSLEQVDVDLIRHISGVWQ